MKVGVKAIEFLSALSDLMLKIQNILIQYKFTFQIGRNYYFSSRGWYVQRIAKCVHILQIERVNQGFMKGKKVSLTSFYFVLH